ncbi:MAG: hypothetical protein MUE94_12700 [Verrucomicrobia bacterium]|nr:hypothetical protein [Verrucomicrobiota bacterium]
MAVEVADAVFAEKAALGHDAKEVLQRRGEAVRIVNPGLQDLAKELLGQESGVFGEEAKDDTIEETGDAEIFLLRKVHLRPRLGVRQLGGFPLLKGLGNLGNGFGQVLGHLRRRALGLQEVGVREHGAEKRQVFRAVNLGVGELLRLLNRAVEVRLDDVAVKVAHHQQGRIQQRFPVAEQLLVRFIEVLLLALVFPRKTALLPHVSKTALVRFGFLSGLVQRKKLRVFHHTLLEAEHLAGRVFFQRRRHAQQAAEVVKV